jgi:hypothetical protein
VPVHADIPHQEVIFLDETDPISSPMKAKGVAELGICGVARRRQRDLQRDRRARARLSDHARQAAAHSSPSPENILPAVESRPAAVHCCCPMLRRCGRKERCNVLGETVLKKLTALK